MFSITMLPLLAAAVLPNPAPARSAVVRDDPPVRVSLNHQSYEPGDRARVSVRVRDDGYLMVLQLAPSGEVRVLFPLDPGDDNFVRGGQSYEIRGRGDRNAFTVDGSDGTGTVYAAWSTEPYRFDNFVRDDHWDYRVLSDSLLPNNPEAGFTELVQQMATGHFDYDLVTYQVERQVATQYVPMYYPEPVIGGCWWDDPWCRGYYPGVYPGYWFGISIGFGPFWGGYYPYYYPYYYRPYFYRPFFYRPFFYRPPIIIASRPFGYRYPYYTGFGWKRSNPGGGGVIGVQYRPRSVFTSPGTRAGSPLFAASRFHLASGHTADPVAWRRPAAATPRGREGASFGGAYPMRTPVRTPASIGMHRGVVNGVDRPAPRGMRVEPRTSEMRTPDVRLPSGPRSPNPRVYGTPVRTYASPARVEQPRYAEPRVETPRSYSPPARVERPSYSPPPTRVEEPRYSPPPRVEAPRYSPPPRVEAPRYSPPPHVAAPRGGGGGGGWAGHRRP